MSKPWEWGANVDHMWRTTIDMRDGFDGDVVMRVRDLWKHKDIGDYKRSISMKVKSHSLEIIKLHALR